MVRKFLSWILPVFSLCPPWVGEGPGSSSYYPCPWEWNLLPPFLPACVVCFQFGNWSGISFHGQVVNPALVSAGSCSPAVSWTSFLSPCFSEQKKLRQVFSKGGETMKLCSGCPLQPLAGAASQGHVKTTPATSSHACLHPHPLNQHRWQQRQGKSISIKFPDDTELMSQAHGSQGRRAGMRFQGAGLGLHSCRARGGGRRQWAGTGTDRGGRGSRPFHK